MPNLIYSTLMRKKQRDFPNQNHPEKSISYGFFKTFVLFSCSDGGHDVGNTGLCVLVGRACSCVPVRSDSVSNFLIQFDERRRTLTTWKINSMEHFLARYSVPLVFENSWLGCA